MKKVYVGDVGTTILLDIGQDLVGAAVAIKVEKPSGIVTSWPATVYVEDDRASCLRYATVAGDLDQVGTYWLQPVVTLADGWSGRGDRAKIDVCK